MHLGSYFKITEVTLIFRLRFSTVTVMYQFLQKMVWATFCAIFNEFIWPPWPEKKIVEPILQKCD
jgi:hypothetical protein